VAHRVRGSTSLVSLTDECVWESRPTTTTMDVHSSDSMPKIDRTLKAFRSTHALPLGYAYHRCVSKTSTSLTTKKRLRRQRYRLPRKHAIPQSFHVDQQARADSGFRMEIPCPLSTPGDTGRRRRDCCVCAYCHCSPVDLSTVQSARQMERDETDTKGNGRRKCARGKTRMRLDGENLFFARCVFVEIV